ncbi:MAG TPA: MlaD family protein [Xanthobacteraceae bacterium]|nr:MlaD family protein [Xanthobacteraceae bacterium]
MERKANYVLIGLFTFAAIAAAFAFVFWIHYSGDKKQGVAYRVIFDGAVSGLRVGSSVLFNGIRVGEVTALRLNPDTPSQVTALIIVNKATPIRSDTYVGLEFTGLTGIASVSLKGISATTPLLEREEGEPPTLKADISASQDMMQAARDVLAKADALIVANQDDIRKAIQNVTAFSDSLARNSDNLDAIMKNSKEATASAKELMDNLDKRTAEMSGNFNKLMTTATDQVKVIGKAVTDLAHNPQRILFGGGASATPGR